MVFCSKRNQYGHRKYLEIDLDKKIIRYPVRWYSSDFIEVTKKELNKITQGFIDAGFIEEV